RALLLKRDHVARAHHAAFMAPAFAHAYAAHGRLGVNPLIVREFETGVGPPRFVVRAQPQILVNSEKLEHLAPIHLPFRLERILHSRNACTNSSPNICGRSSARDCPSPCSPESDPP